MKNYLQLNRVNSYVISYHLSNYVWNKVVKWEYFSKETIGKQFVRAIDSISANIAEGFGKSSINDKVKYYEIAKGSAFETKSHLYYGQKVGYFNENTINLLLEELNATIFEINKLKKALKIK